MISILLSAAQCENILTGFARSVQWFDNHPTIKGSSLSANVIDETRTSILWSVSELSPNGGVLNLNEASSEVAYWLLLGIVVACDTQSEIGAETKRLALELKQAQLAHNRSEH